MNKIFFQEFTGTEIYQVLGCHLAVNHFYTLVETSVDKGSQRNFRSV